MLSLRPDFLRDLPIGLATTWLVGVCMEARGKEQLWTLQRPELLAALREQAIIQSTESSNRIEGVTVERERLRPVVLGETKPRDRPEEELAGYRQALSWIFSESRRILFSPQAILALHGIAQGGFSGDAGRWKSRDSEIVEILPSGERRVRFTPTPAADVPRAINDLCLNYADLLEQDQIPPLIIIAAVIFDFLCIHPFRDGNGRVSRLLTILLLQQHQFTVGRYISLERIIEETKESYYDVLARCSAGWHEGCNELLPWINYFLSTLKRAYDEFALRVEGTEGSKADFVRLAIERQNGPFSLADIQAQCPSVSPALIKKTLAEMKAVGLISLSGRGRGARWVKRNRP